jgi:hypothetical protein
VQQFGLLYPSEYRLKRAVRVLDDFAYQLISVRKTEADLRARGDLLSLCIDPIVISLSLSLSLVSFYILTRSLCTVLSMLDEKNRPYDARFIRDMALNFILAGRDTTACTLTFLFYLLAQNPQHEAKVVEEIRATHPGDSVPDYESVKNLSYMNACINETLRLYPPVPVDPKQTLEDDVLPNGIVVPKGTTVSWSAYVRSHISFLSVDCLPL